jgi:hypothetical protein
MHMPRDTKTAPVLEDGFKTVEPTFTPPPGIVEPSAAQKQAAIDALKRTDTAPGVVKPPADIPAGPISFLFEGERVAASEPVLKALEVLGAALLAQAKASDPLEADLAKAGKPSAWTWVRFHLGDLMRETLTITYGSEAGKPDDGCGAVAIVGVK